MADNDFTPDEYGLLGNAAAAPDGRFRYAEPSDPSQKAPIEARIRQLTARLVKPGYLRLIPQHHPDYPDFEITAKGRQLLEARST